MVVRPPTIFDLDLFAPHSSQDTPSLKRPQDSCSDNEGLAPCKELSVADILKRRTSKVSVFEEPEYGFLADAGEDPEADLEAFTTYETMPSRAAWSGISKDQYVYVKRMFARRGVTICKDSSKADIMKFKDTLLNMRTYFF
ncbi:hypothetical protein COCOBI_13-3370 [Coccomyxa sp. Obi]|nr:hypothetical protein COCOBI_13-3370 [Coccomyxa sp. Obi]